MRQDYLAAESITSSRPFHIELCELLGAVRPSPVTKDPSQGGYI